jgi:hypothetical protein
MRREVCFELSKESIRHKLQLKPVPNTPKYQIFIDGNLKYMGAGFRLDECAERLSFFEKSGFVVKILSAIKEKGFKDFPKAWAGQVGVEDNGTEHRSGRQQARAGEPKKMTTAKPDKTGKSLKRSTA